MHSPAFPDDTPRMWGVAASPSPAAAVSRHRAPRDDAPVYDPLLWMDTNNAYISTLATHVMVHQPPTAGGRKPAAKPPLEKFLSSSWVQSSEEAAAAARLSKFHGVYDRRPATWVGRVLQYISAKLFPRWHEEVRPEDVAALSTEDLIHLMQLALAAGEMDRSAMLARELSRRKQALQMQVYPTHRSNGGVATGCEREAITSPIPRPISATNYTNDIGFLPRREVLQQASSQQPGSHWGDHQAHLAVSRASSWSQQRSVYSLPARHDNFGASRPVSADRVSMWDGDTDHQPPLRSPAMPPASVETSQYVSDVDLSSLRPSEGGSGWRNNSRRSG